MGRSDPELWGCCLCCVVTCARCALLCWNHNRHWYVGEHFVHDVLPSVDDCHQLERAAMHAFWVETFTQEDLWVVGGCLLGLVPPPPPWG